MPKILPQNDALDLLCAALDPQGFMCIVGIGPDKIARQYFFQPGDYQAAVDKAMRLSNDGIDAYFGTSSLMSDKSRKADNTHAMKCFKFDLDVELGNSAKYTSKRGAVEALATFCQQTGLPVPTLVDSGGGVHAYWCLTEALSASDGKKYGETLKAVCAVHGLKADPTVTADVARILRVPDTLNYKKAVARRVKLRSPVVVHNTDDILDKLDALYVAATGQRAIAVHVPQQGVMLGSIPEHLKRVQIDDNTRSLLQGRPKSFAVIVDRSNAGTGCNQIADIHQNQAAQDEPRWRVGLSIAHFCADGCPATIRNSGGDN